MANYIKLPLNNIGMEERNDSIGHSAVTSIYFSHVENERQVCKWKAGETRGKTGAIFCICCLKDYLI